MSSVVRFCLILMFVFPLLLSLLSSLAHLLHVVPLALLSVMSLLSELLRLLLIPIHFPLIALMSYYDEPVSTANRVPRAPKFNPARARGSVRRTCAPIHAGRTG